MHTEMRIEEFVASLREDARDLALPDKDKRALAALAEHVRRFTPPDELARNVIEEEAELHGVRPEDLRPKGRRGRREVTKARYAVVRRLGSLGFSVRKIAGLLGYSHHGPVALILTHKREVSR
jgi:hypothetical protein